MAINKNGSALVEIHCNIQLGSRCMAAVLKFDLMIEIKKALEKRKR